MAIDSTQQPVTLSDGNGTPIPTGQATSASSLPVVISSDQTAIPISDGGGSVTVDGTITTNIGTTGGLALDVTLTTGTQRSRITDGTNNAAVKAASTAAVATDPALVVAISPNSPLTATNPSVGSNTSAIPTSSTQIGGSDGTNLQAVRIFDVDSGAGTQYVLGTTLRKSASGGSVEAGTSADPLRTDPTGTTTQPISGTVTSNIGTTNGLALDSTLTGGTQRSRITDGTNNAAVKAASTAAIASDPALVVAISPNSPLTATNPSVGINTSAIPTSSTQVGGSDGTNLQAARVFDADTGAGTQYILGAILRKAASGGSVEAGTSSDPLRTDPTGTTNQPISGTVTSNIGTTNGLALDATLTGGAQRSRLTDGTNNVAVKAASIAAVASDPSLVVSISPNNSVAITAVSLPLPTGASTSAKQPSLGVAGTASSDVITVQGIASMVALKVDGSATTQPISGTVTSNIGTTNGLALDATLTGGSQRTRLTDGTTNVSVKAASTLPIASDTALVVSLRDSIQVTIPAGGYGGEVEGLTADATISAGNPVLLGGYESATTFVRRIAVDALGRIITTTAGTATSVAGFSFGEVTLAFIGVAARVNKTPYTEQAVNFTGSIASSSALDTSAGTGARQVKITWMDSTGTTIGTETVTLNGVTFVNLVTTTKCFIEKVEVISVGTGGTNAGTLTLKTGSAGAGTTVCTVVAGEWTTYFCHHYVPLGKTCYITSLSANNTSSAVGNGCAFQLRAKFIVGTSPDSPISDKLRVYGQSSSVSRNFGTAIPVVGPAYITGWATPESNISIIERMSFDFYDQ